MKKSLVLLAVLSLSVACSKKESDKGLAKMNEMTAQTNKIQEQIISKNAEETRNNKFEILNSKDEKIGSKIAAAAIYFQSMEFQLGSSKTKEELLFDATTEFTKRIGGIYEDINLKRMSPSKEGKRHSAEQSFYAISITMHLNNHYKEKLIDKEAGLKATSFYDVMKSALVKDYNRDSMLEYEEVLVANINKEIMIELVKARVDMFTALALKNLTDKRNITLGQRIRAALFKLTDGKYGSIELPEVFAKSNEPTKKQTINLLEAATKAKSFLTSIGVEKELEKNVRSALSKINFDESSQSDEPEVQEEEAGESKEESDSRKVQIQELINGLLQ